RDATPEALLGDVDQLLDLGRDLADGHRDGGVAVPAVHDRTAVDGDDVALHELSLPRDAVHHLVIDGGADRGRERRRAVPLEGWDASTRANVVLSDGVQL